MTYNIDERADLFRSAECSLCWHGLFLGSVIYSSSGSQFEQVQWECKHEFGKPGFARLRGGDAHSFEA